MSGKLQGILKRQALIIKGVQISHLQRLLLKGKGDEDPTHRPKGPDLNQRVTRITHIAKVASPCLCP